MIRWNMQVMNQWLLKNVSPLRKSCGQISFSKGRWNPLSHLYSTLIYDNPNMSTDFAEVQQRLYSHTAWIVEAMKSPRLQEGEREWIMLLAEEVMS